MTPKHNHVTREMERKSCPACQYYAHKALLGKRVRVVMNLDDKNAVSTGKLLGFGEGGDFEILEDDGFIHYCWPMLEIEEIG